ncbi:hypothetical protein DPX16_0813 [Anabarilius grahami]|uniref:Uncharacterized protein n=1 Tax=Anabarilius grahami TaxID=495550 RepID=A0A3N0ZAY2_ANAGA|nr:hypothetical protein DPX16_0813 [Anabarilius grahami]
MADRAIQGAMSGWAVWGVMAWTPGSATLATGIWRPPKKKLGTRKRVAYGLWTKERAASGRRREPPRDEGESRLGTKERAASGRRREPPRDEGESHLGMKRRRTWREPPQASGRGTESPRDEGQSHLGTRDRVTSGRGTESPRDEGQSRLWTRDEGQCRLWTRDEGQCCLWTIRGSDQKSINQKFSSSSGEDLGMVGVLAEGSGVAATILTVGTDVAAAILAEGSGAVGGHLDRGLRCGGGHLDRGLRHGGGHLMTRLWSGGHLATRLRDGGHPHHCTEDLRTCWRIAMDGFPERRSSAGMVL